MAPSAQVHPSEYDYKSICREMEPVMDETKCYVCEWYEEKLPLENKEGTSMEQVLQNFIEESPWNDPYYEYIRPENEKAPEIPEWEDKHKTPKAEKVLVFSDSAGYCDGILKHAPEGRIASKQIMTGYDYGPEDIEKLFKKKWDLVILGFCDLPETNAAVDVAELSNKYSKLLYHISKYLNDHPEHVKRMAVITRGATSNEEEDHQEVGLGMCVGGAMFGHTRTLRMEIAAGGTDVKIQYIDTEVHKDLPEWMEGDTYLLPRLSAEVFRLPSFGHNDVRILHSGRYVLRQVPADDYEKAGWEFEVPDHGIIGIAGGNGALGLIMGMWLVNSAEKQKKSGFKIAFLSRSCKIGDDNAKQWKKIEQKAAKLGIEVAQEALDASNKDDVDDWIEGCNGKLQGFIYSAGVLRDKMLKSLEWEECMEVFTSKHISAMYIHEALLKFPQPELSFFWVFSSIAAYGNLGQWNYSGSNSFKDSLARHRRAIGLPGCAMQWGGWGEVGMAAKMDAQMRRRMDQSQIPSFSTKDGLLGMEAGLRTGLPGFAVFKYNAKTMFESFDDCVAVSACHQRNFTSEICPTPITFEFKRKHMMTIFRMSHGSYAAHGNNLIWNKFVYPWVEMEDEDEDDEAEYGKLVPRFEPGNMGNTTVHY